MRTLLEEIDELLSRAKYMHEKRPNIAIAPDYWTRLKSVCDQARQFTEYDWAQKSPVRAVS